MNFGELVQEAALRGFQSMLDGGAQEARIKRYVNYAHREVVGAKPWPFLPALIEGTMPLEIADLAHVLSVSDLGDDRILDPIDERQATRRDPDRDEVGAARYWFRSDLTHIDVWPKDTSTFAVRYVRRAIPMVEATDEPLTPEEYDELIISGAVNRLYRNRDNFEAAQLERAEWKLGMEAMEHELLKPNYDREKQVARTGRPGDYL